MRTHGLRIPPAFVVAPRVLLVLGLLAGSLGAGAARATDIQWANAAGGGWGDAANWYPEQVPSVGDRAFLTLPGTYTVTIAVADIPVVDEITLGGTAGQQVLVVQDNASLQVSGSALVGALGIVQLGAGASFSADGTVQNSGRIETTSAQVRADLGLENTGVIELGTDTNVSGAVRNRGTLRTTGTVNFATFVNESGGSLEVLTGPGSLPGAVMDTLVNRGHVDLRTAVTLVASDLLSNEPFAVLTVAESASTLSAQTVNAGVVRIAAGGSLGGDFQQLASGELEGHYSVSKQQFFVVGQSVVLDGTFSPVFDAGFAPPAGNLPLLFAQAMSGQFAVVSQAGTGGRQVRALYLSYVFLQVFDPALAIFPSHGGDSGTLTAVISGSQLSTVLAARLRRTGESDIVADPVSRDPGSGIVTARFDLAGRTRGTWDVVLDGPSSATETAADAFTIEAPVKEPVRVEIFGRNRLRLGSSSDWSVLITNPGNVDAIGAVQLQAPGGLGWELSVWRPGAAAPSGVAGQFEQTTTLVVPGLELPPGSSTAAVRIRLTCPVSPPVPGVTLQARWFQE